MDRIACSVYLYKGNEITVISGCEQFRGGQDYDK